MIFLAFLAKNRRFSDNSERAFSRRTAEHVVLVTDRMYQEVQVLLGLLWSIGLSTPWTALSWRLSPPLLIGGRITTAMEVTALATSLCSWRHFALSLVVTFAVPYAAQTALIYAHRVMNDLEVHAVVAHWCRMRNTALALAKPKIT